MIADEGCWERGCACHDSRDSPGVELVRKREWVGLTDEEKNQVAWSCGAMSADWLEFVEAIEAKLKEKNDLHKD